MRCRWHGWWWFFATSVGDKHPFGIEGWRFAFFLIASVSIFTGILTAVMASDPRMVGMSPWPLPFSGKAGCVSASFPQTLQVTGYLQAIRLLCLIKA